SRRARARRASQPRDAAQHQTKPLLGVRLQFRRSAGCRGCAVPVHRLVVEPDARERGDELELDFGRIERTALAARAPVKSASARFTRGLAGINGPSRAETMPRERSFHGALAKMKFFRATGKISGASDRS